MEAGGGRAHGAPKLSVVERARLISPKPSLVFSFCRSPSNRTNAAGRLARHAGWIRRFRKRVCLSRAPVVLPERLTEDVFHLFPIPDNTAAFTPVQKSDWARLEQVLGRLDFHWWGAGGGRARRPMSNMGFWQQGHWGRGLGGAGAGAGSGLSSRARTRSKRFRAAGLSQPKWRTRCRPLGNTCCRKRCKNAWPVSVRRQFWPALSR